MAASSLFVVTNSLRLRRFRSHAGRSHMSTIAAPTYGYTKTRTR